MEAMNATLSTSAGSPARLTLTTSSSPSPTPVLLSPACSTLPSGDFRLLKKTKCWSERTLPVVPHTIALASRSKSSPVVVRTSQPSPNCTAVSPGASLLRLTLPPFVRRTATGGSSQLVPVAARLVDVTPVGPPCRIYRMCIARHPDIGSWRCCGVDLVGFLARGVVGRCGHGGADSGGPRYRDVGRHARYRDVGRHHRADGRPGGRR